MKRDFFAAASYGGLTWARRNNYTRIGVIGYVLAPKHVDQTPDAGAELYVGHVAGEEVPQHINADVYALRMRRKQESFLVSQRLAAAMYRGPNDGPTGGPSGGPSGGAGGDLSGVTQPEFDDLSANVHAHARDFFAAYVVASDVKLRRTAFIHLRSMCKGVDKAQALLASGSGTIAAALRDAKDICEYTLQMCTQLRRQRIEARDEARAAGAIASTTRDTTATLRREVSRLEAVR